jgi:putative transposase
VVQRFKTMTTRLYIEGVHRLGWPSFRGRLWQRNYFEHILRGEESLERIRLYIAENPSRWPLDPENPSAMGTEARPSWMA